MKKIVSLFITLVMVFALTPSVFADWHETSSGNKWYTDDSGKKYEGLKKIDGKYYYFDRTNNDHYMKKGFITITSDDSKSIYYFGSDGSMVFNKWVTKDGYKCYFGKDGKAATGWKEIGGKKYYFGNRIISDDLYKGVAAATGERIIGTRLYEFDEEGALVDGDTYDVGQIPIFWLAAFDPYGAAENTAATAFAKNWKEDFDKSKEFFFIDTTFDRSLEDEKLYASDYRVTLFKADYNVQYAFTDKELSSVYLSRNCTDEAEAVISYAGMASILTKAYGATALSETHGQKIACVQVSQSNSKEVPVIDSIARQVWSNGDTTIRLDLLAWTKSGDINYVVQVRYYDNTR